MGNFDDFIVEDYVNDALEALELVNMDNPRCIFHRSNYYGEMSQIEFFQTVMTLLTQIENLLVYPDDR